MIIERISRETGVNPAVLRVIISTASRRYKTYKILKRTRGVREINHPTPAIKFLQRWVVRNLIAHLPVHQNVMSYKRGIGISENAEMHVAQNYLLKMDFGNFFPSIKSDDVRKLIVANVGRPSFVGLVDEDVDIILAIVCKDEALTIGAPSSPAISNAILYAFDEYISKECAKRSVVYSRYADDISFSTNEPDVLTEIKLVVERALKNQESPRLSINEDKTIFTSKKRIRMVTGLTLTSDEKVSIGRDKKREIKTLCYLFKKGELAAERIAYLRRYLSFVHSVEPRFMDSLRKKYGTEVVERILGAPLVQRK
jgi:RNA-directed DNA polymerase